MAYYFQDSVPAAEWTVKKTGEQQLRECKDGARVNALVMKGKKTGGNTARKRSGSISWAELEGRAGLR